MKKFGPTAVSRGAEAQLASIKGSEKIGRKGKECVTHGDGDGEADLAVEYLSIS